MTAFAIKFARRRIDVAADTAVFLPDRREPRPLGHLNKVFPFPHLHALLFGRGMQQIIIATAALIAQAPLLATIEAAARDLPHVLTACTRRYCEQVGITDPAAFGLAEVVLAGWSAAERRMMFWYFVNTNGYEPRVDAGDYGFLTMPRLPDRLLPSGGSLAERLVAALLAQQREFAGDGVMIGGEIHRWSLTPDGISQRVIYRFADHAEAARDGAALLRRILAGEERVSVVAGLVPAGELRRADGG